MKCLFYGFLISGTIAVTAFLVYGAFWVNLPVGNIGWVVYDIGLIPQVWILFYLFHLIIQRKYEKTYY